MRAVYVGSVPVDDPLAGLRIGEQPEPDLPARGSVRIHVDAAGVNWHDLWTLRGVSPRPVRPPVILGMEGAGRLDDGTPVMIHPVIVDSEWLGDETLDPNRHTPSEGRPGTFAESVVVPSRNAVELPAGLDPIVAAVLGTAWLTAYRMAFTKAGVVAGQTVLVQGSSGGVSTALIQLVSAAGVRVWATGRTQGKRALATYLGADDVFPVGADLPGKVDAAFDCVGQATWSHSVHAVRDGGRVITCAATTGDAPSAELRHLVRHQIDVRGTQAGTLAELHRLIAFVVGRRITPHIGAIMPMSKAHEALRRLWRGDSNGKIVLTNPFDGET